MFKGKYIYSISILETQNKIKFTLKIVLCFVKNLLFKINVLLKLNRIFKNL